MNESAMEAITAKSPNERAKMIRVLAQRCIDRYPYKRHSEAGVAAFVMAAWYAERFVETGTCAFPSLRGWAIAINDVISVWEYLIEGGAL